MKHKKKKIIIQLNEMNFDLVRKYLSNDNFTGFKRLFALCNYNTHSEKKYEHLEPWIQWYSFYTGLSLKQHKVHHLGDSLKNNHKTFLDESCDKGLKVGTFGSMNLKPHNELEVFIPDPWSEAISDKSFSSRIVSRTMKKIINKNANLKINISDLIGIIVMIGIPNSARLFNIIFKSIISFVLKKRYSLASYFDYIFCNYSLKQTKSKKLDLSLIFLNGFAHVQHHYLLSSHNVKGENPEWYMSKDEDPIKESLIVYDLIIENILNHYKEHEVYFITGLSQVPYKKPELYWRFKNHEDIFKKFFSFEFSVIPRMTRDFELKLKKSSDVSKAMNFLKNAKVIHKKKSHAAFGFIDKVSKLNIFASFIYNKEIDDAFLRYRKAKIYLKDNLDFVAIKNGGHSEKGWLFTNKSKTKLQRPKIWEVHKEIR